MKKATLLVALFIMLTIPISAHASAERALKVFPSLTFQGKTAECSITVLGNNAEDEISIVAKLWLGSSCIETWNDSGTGHMNFSTSTVVSSSGQYKLTADVTINGNTLPTVSATGYCK